MISLSSHVLDTTAGKPVSNMDIDITDPQGQVFKGKTDSDGRCKVWQGLELSAGQYMLRFYCQTYLVEKHGESFYPYVDINFELLENGGHYHVPLLISPFGFSSYRGS